MSDCWSLVLTTFLGVGNAKYLNEYNAAQEPAFHIIA